MRKHGHSVGGLKLCTARWLRRVHLRFGIWASERPKVLDLPGVRRLSTWPGAEECDTICEPSQR
jgi:hypothetical protein